MKKLLPAILALMLALLCLTPALAEDVDVVSAASAMDFYGAYALTGDDLMAAINSTSGFYTITTVDEAGNPNTGFFIYQMMEKDGEYYLVFALAPNATLTNLQTSGKALAVYAATPTGDTAYAVSGARMWCELVTDEALNAELNQLGEGALIFHVTAIRSLG